MQLSIKNRNNFCCTAIWKHRPILHHYYNLSKNNFVCLLHSYNKDRNATTIKLNCNGALCCIYKHTCSYFMLLFVSVYFWKCLDVNTHIHSQNLCVVHVAYLKDLIEIMIKNDKFQFYFIKCAKLFWHLPPSPPSSSHQRRHRHHSLGFCCSCHNLWV